MKSFVKKHIGGNPLKGNSLEDFRGKQGVIVFADCGWSDASGHIDLFNGKEVESQEYFNRCGKVLLYELK